MPFKDNRNLEHQQKYINKQIPLRKTYINTNQKKKEKEMLELRT